MPRSQDKDDAEASARHTRSKWKRLRHTMHRGNDVFWYEHGNVFFSVKPLLFLQLERSLLQLVVCNGFLKKNQQVQHEQHVFYSAAHARKPHPCQQKLQQKKNALLLGFQLCQNTKGGCTSPLGTITRATIQIHPALCTQTKAHIVAKFLSR